VNATLWMSVLDEGWWILWWIIWGGLRTIVGGKMMEFRRIIWEQPTSVINLNRGEFWLVNIKIHDIAPRFHYGKHMSYKVTDFLN